MYVCMYVCVCVYIYHNNFKSIHGFHLLKIIYLPFEKNKKQKKPQ